MNFLSKLLQGMAYMPTIITGVENLFGARSGTDKKNAVLSFVEATLSVAEAVSNQQIVDEAKFRAGLDMVITGTVQCLNASMWAKPNSTPQ